jgi:hypothetical protein
VIRTVASFEQSALISLVKARVRTDNPACQCFSCLLWGVRMAPPDVGSDVAVRRSGKVTRYNDDNTVNVKFDSGRGRPHKIKFGDVLDRSLDCESATATVLEPLPPFSPLPSLGTMVASNKGVQRSKKFYVLSWATAAAVAGAIGIGILHGMGARLFEMMWPHLH